MRGKAKWHSSPESKINDKQRGERLKLNAEWIARIKLFPLNPEWRAAHLEGIQKVWQDPEYVERYKKGIERLWTNPEHREKMKQANLKVLADPEWLLHTTKANQAKVLDPEWKTAHLAGCRRRSDSEAWKIAHREGCIKRASDPVWQAKAKEQLEKARKVIAIRQAEADALLSPEELTTKLKQREYNRLRAQKKRNKVVK